jgi:microcystin-dependent protein
MSESDAFVGEVRMFAFDYAPVGWALCAGQLLPINQNPVLFSLIQTSFGGNGKTTFALPNLQGTSPMHTGQGQGLSPRVLGEEGGVPSVTLVTHQLPTHDHTVAADQGLATSADPADGIYMKGNYDDGMGPAVGVQLYNTSQPDTPLAVESLQPAGESRPHNNIMPSLSLNFCIALQGIFPTRGATTRRPVTARANAAQPKEQPA